MKRYYVFLTLFCLSCIVRAFPADPIPTTDKDAKLVFADRDRDGVYDDRDNCPDVYNPFQDDSDNDGIGDVCDSDDCDCNYENQWIYVCQDGKTRRVTCSALTNPNTFCGPCEENKVECASCEPDEYGKITFCRIPLNPNNLRTVYGNCNELYNYFNNDGSFKNSKDKCGPCDCAMIGDVDSDGDGVCDKKDECPDNPEKSEAGMCGCDDDDTDKDWVCDSEDVCPGWNDKKDDDGDGIPNGCDICPHGDDNKDYDGDGIPDACDICPHGDDNKDYDGDGIPDACDICPGGDDEKDYDGDGIPDACDICPVGDDEKDYDGDGIPDACDICPGGDDEKDYDGDGIPDACDICPVGDDEKDYDGDGIPDACDICPVGDDEKDYDGDGIPDACDICPGGDDEKDYDGDGIPDACDICNGGDDEKDYDGDGIPDACDICPQGDDKKDYDGDGIPDACDICPGGDDNEDQNNNGVPDSCELDCCPASGYSDYEWIDNTKFNDIFTNSGDDGGYGDYRSVKIRTSRGANLSLWVTPGYIDDICELSIAAYIDWNGDKDFDDDGELVYFGRTLEENGADVPVPQDAYLGEVCVRIIVDYGRIRGACDPCIDGEVEDYTLIIEDNLCSSVYEPFDYAFDSDIQGKNGGQGWSSPWLADKSGNARARVLQNSLIYTPLESNGHKLAVMNEPISLLTVKRELDYAAEDELWMSFLYMRDGGQGTFFLEFGDLVFDINSAGNFWIGDLSGQAVQNQVTYFILIKVVFTPEKEDVYVWINPNTDYAPDPNDALHVQLDIENSFEDLSMTFKSIDGSETIYQYVDEIRIGCERSDVAIHDPGDGNVNSAVPSSFIVAPNPVTPGFPVGIILNNSSFFEGTFSIYTNDGQPVKTGTIYAGLNTLDTDGMLPGIYLMEIKTNDSVMTERLLIQN